MSSECKFCRLDRSSPNTSKHLAGDTLPMVSARDNICKPCRGTQTVSYAGVTRTALAKSLENPAKFSEYMKARDKWLRLHNEAESGWVTRKAFTEELGMNDMSGVRVEEEQGNFWTTELYKKNFKQDPPYE